MSITFGRVPYPETIKSYLPASNPYVVESGAPPVPDMVFWHRMIGTWQGTNGWFHAGNAATMYGVAVAATDGSTNAGKIYEWIKPGIGWYGESSGPAVKPYGDGAKFIAEVGVGRVNQRSVAIEISGNYGTPLDEASRFAIVRLTAYWADRRRIPWHAFPMVPGTNGRSFVGWHQEITGPEYKECPGDVVISETPALIERTKAFMRSWQEGDLVEPDPKPAPIWWGLGDVGGQKRPSDGAVAYAFLGEVTALRNVPIFAHVGGEKVHTMKLGDKAVIRGTYLQPNGDKKPIPWAFIQYTNDPNKVGRARLSAFFPRWPTV